MPKRVLCPQTKFVLKKAIELNLIPLVVVNKIDKPSAEPDRVVNEVFDLLVALDANDEQVGVSNPICSWKRWRMRSAEIDDENIDMKPLFEAIIEYVPSPSGSRRLTLPSSGIHPR